METSAKALSVVVVVSSLRAGGTERVAVRICEWLRDVGHDACLLTLSSQDSDFHACPHGVARIALGLQGESRSIFHALWNNIRRIGAVRAAARERNVDVVISLGSNTNVLMLLALVGSRCRKIISERANPLLRPLPPFWDWLRRITYPTASLHIAQSKYVLDWARYQFPKLPSLVIGNTSGRETDQLLPEKREERSSCAPLRLLAIGRLNREKGMDILLDAFALAHHRFEKLVELIIVGDGDERQALVAQCRNLGLDGSVYFIGNVSDVWPYLYSADMYVLPSRTEGFPNALVEAMSAGLPVIAARCLGGVEDVLGEVPGRYSLEFPPEDTEALAQCLVNMANSSERRRKLAANALERSADYSPQRISAAWVAAVELK